MHKEKELTKPTFLHSLVCWPLSSSTGVVGDKCLAKWHLSESNEGALPFTFPTQICPTELGGESKR